jgi:integrase
MAEGVYKRGRSYVVVVPFGKTPEGKYRQKWFSGFKTVTEAKAYRARILNLQEQGGRVESTRLTVAEYLDTWVESHAPHLSPVTLESYHSVIRAHLKPSLGSIRLKQLGPEPIREYMTAKLAGKKDDQGTWEQKPLSTTTVRYHLTVLREAIQQAVRDGLLMRNWVDNVTRPKRQRTEMTVLDEEQIRLFLAEAKRSSKHYTLYLAAVLTGMREGELLGLRWRDVDLTLGVASVQQTLYRLYGKDVKDKLLFKEPKTQKARRTVDLPPVLVEALRALREEQVALQREFGPAYQDHDLIFCQPDGKPAHGQNITRHDFRRVLALKGLRSELLATGVPEEALPKGLPRIRFHDLRHSHATLLLQQGVHPKVVQERLGHSTIAMTLDTYSHSVPGMQRRAADKLGERLFGHG